MKWLDTVCVTGGCCLLGAVAAFGEAKPAPAVPAGTNIASVPKTGGELEKLLDEGQRGLEDQKWAVAARAFEKALKIAPGNEVARFGLGTTYIKLEQYKDALAVLDSLLAQFPANPALRNNIAWVYAKAKDPAIRNPRKAIRYAQDAILAVPADYNVWGTLAEAYYAAGQYDRGGRFARIALRLADAARDPNIAEFEELFERCRVAAGTSDEEKNRD